MLIQIPVLIAFDCDKGPFGPQRAADERFFTLRYDTDPNVDRKAEYCLDYPPRANAEWFTDRSGVLFDLFTRNADKAITKRVTSDPETYAATEAAR